MAALGNHDSIPLPADRRLQVERIKAAYAAADGAMARIAVLNDGSLGSVVTRVLAAVEIHDERRKEV